MAQLHCECKWVSFCTEGFVFNSTQVLCTSISILWLLMPWLFVNHQASACIDATAFRRHNSDLSALELHVWGTDQSLQYQLQYTWPYSTAMHRPMYASYLNGCAATRRNSSAFALELRLVHAHPSILFIGYSHCESYTIISCNSNFHNRRGINDN